MATHRVFLVEAVGGLARLPLGLSGLLALSMGWALRRRRVLS